MKLIIIAHQLEAKPLVETLHAELIESKGYVKCFQYSEGLIVISGMGVAAAQFAATQYGREADEIWNMGIAGALQSELTLGQICTIGSTCRDLPVDRNALDSHSQKIVKMVIPTLQVEEDKWRLVSTDFPVHDKQHKAKLQIHADLVDMEGYGIAYAANALGKKCRIWKIISDFSQEGGRQIIEKNINRLAHNLAEHLVQQHESCIHP